MAPFIRVSGNVAIDWLLKTCVYLKLNIAEVVPEFNRGALFGRINSQPSYKDFFLFR